MPTTQQDDRWQDDPYERRRRSVRRTRVVAATLGAAALVGTGVLTVSLAAPDTSTQAGATTGSSTDQQSAAGGIGQSQQAPTAAGAGAVHASSGGS